MLSLTSKLNIDQLIALGSIKTDILTTRCPVPAVGAPASHGRDLCATGGTHARARDL